MTTPVSPSAPGAAGRTDPAASALTSLLARHPGLRTIDAQLSRDTARLSSLGKLALALDDFRASAARLTGGKLDMVVGVGGKAVSARLADATAAAGTHTVEVKQLAQAQQLASAALPGKNAAIGTGAPTLVKVTVGSGPGATTSTLRIGASNNTLEGIAKAMRDAGLDARVTEDGKGHALSLTGPTGAANTMRISVEGDPALGALLSYGAAGPNGMRERAGARDAQVLVDGKAMSVPGNRLDKAIPGVSLGLTALGSSEVKVGRDPAAVAGKVKDLVAAFNTLGTRLGGAAGTAPDPLAGRLKAEIGRILDGADPKALAELGITHKDGNLVLDEAKLKAASAANPEKLGELFGKPGGLAEQFVARVGEHLKQGGMLAEQAATVKNHMDKLNGQKVRVTEVLQAQASKLAQQYALGAGGSSLFGPSGQARPPSLFDFMA